VTTSNSIAVVRAYDSMYGKGRHSFSIVADDNSVQFVFPKDSKKFNADVHMERLLSTNSEPDSADGWIKLAIKGLGSYDLASVKYSEDISTVGKIVKKEKSFLNSEETSYSFSEGQTPEEQDENLLFQDLMAEDKNFAGSVEDNMGDPSEDSMKQYITNLIVSAGTQEENPWLEPWLNGEDPNTLDFSNGLVLSKPSEDVYKDYHKNFDSSLFEEDEEN